MRLIPFLLALLLSCKPDSTVKNTTVSQQKMIDLSEFEYQPQMVGPYIISKSHFEGHASISRSGNEIYFAIYTNDHTYSTIAYSIKRDGVWQEPEIASFSGIFSDGSPALSPNSEKLFFSSRRPINESEGINSSNDIWYVEKTGGIWGKPQRLPSGINTEFNEFSPSVDMKGNLYFCSNRPGGFGDMDVYYAEYLNGQYQEPVLLSSSINSQYHEGNVGVSPDGTILFLMIQHKPGDWGYDDIHYSLRTGENWSATKNIGSIINTYSYDFSPKVSPDGQTLYFSSRVNRNYTSNDTTYTFDSFESYLNSPLNGLGNIYKIELRKLNLEE